MKFARVLQDSQIPEWKKAYIDYRGLKKLIAPIRIAQQKHQEEIIKSVDEEQDRTRSRSATPPPRSLAFEEPPDVAQRRHSRRMSDSHLVAPPRRASLLGRGGLNRLSLGGILPSLKMPPHSRPNSAIGSCTSRRADLLEGLPLHELLMLLTPQEASYFEMLDAQLEKVESFYLEREREMIRRGRDLQRHLDGLNDENLVLSMTANPMPWASSLKSAFKSGIVRNRTVSPDSVGSVVNSDTTHSTIQSLPTLVSILRFEPQSPIPSVAFSPTPTTPGKRRAIEDDRPRGRILEVSKKENKLKRKPSELLDADLEGCSEAKRKLRKAVLEHYRGLEMLDNFRIINTTGFRKAVKKFEKHTKIQVQDQYMAEKVEKCAFVSSTALKDMMTEMEDKYANGFLNGDRKKATNRLRAGIAAPQTHHFNTFRAGMYLGLAVPALVDGLVKASQQSTREAVPAWGVLLFLYGVFLVPTVFALLVGLNLSVWASARINYAFIFELEVLSRIDYRDYFETPAILLSTLIYTFWLCFAQIGAPPTQLPVPIKSTLWPVLWIVFAVGLIVNPLPIMHRSSRFWFVRKLGRQFLSGKRPVDFTDFWMGDQLCSMTFTLSHLPTLVCVYVHQFQHDSFPTDLNLTCGTSTNMWAAEFIFASLPFAMRLAQSIKRFIDSRRRYIEPRRSLHLDSKRYTKSWRFLHLVNGGKYLAGIVSTFFYLYWRRTDDRGAFFALWCVLNTFASIYACLWDLHMDWSLLNVRNENFLRSELIYANHIYLYYIAIVTNILSRFAWVLYTPIQGPNMLLRSFIVAVLEMLRRWQWNFLRLENEHLGNMDQYRVTRDIPLPYPFNGISRDEDEDEKHFKAHVKRTWYK